MTRAIAIAVAVLSLLLPGAAAVAQQIPCNPAVEYCLPVPPEGPSGPDD